MIDVQDCFKECVGFSMKEVEAIIEDICLNWVFLIFLIFLNFYH